jgi:hypothetical protein
MVWAGARGGWEHVDIDNVTSEPGSVEAGGAPLNLSATATRWWAGGLVGLAAGFRHLHVALELDVSYANVSGDFGGAHAHIAGAAIAPAAALWWHF